MPNSTHIQQTVQSLTDGQTDWVSTQGVLIFLLCKERLKTQSPLPDLLFCFVKNASKLSLHYQIFLLRKERLKTQSPLPYLLFCFVKNASKLSLSTTSSSFFCYVKNASKLSLHYQ